MIDFNKITSTELTELKQIASSAAQKSELERYYLFSSIPTERAKMFVFCHRFLINMHNLIDDSPLRVSIKETIEETSESYLRLLKLVELEAREIRYNSGRRQREIFDLTTSKEVDDLIDLFSVLIEKTHVLQMSKLKGILLEGKSGEEYKKLFDKKKDSVV